MEIIVEIWRKVMLGVRGWWEMLRERVMEERGVSEEVSEVEMPQKSAFSRRDEVDDDATDRDSEQRAFGSKSAVKDDMERGKGVEFGSKSAAKKHERLSRMGVPQTEVEFVEMIKRMPETALSREGRRRLAAVMSFDEKKVKDLMVPRGKMQFVKENEVLGPLVLDKLYKSGLTSFPVVDERDEVVGIIHTEALNALEVREAEAAAKYLDPQVQYLRTNDSLMEAVEKMEQTGKYYYLVKAENGLVVGCLTVGMVLEFLLGR